MRFGELTFKSTQETLRLTAPPLLAWMESQLRSDDAGAEKRLMGFYRFMDAEEAAGTVRFHIKPGLTYCQMHRQMKRMARQ